MVAVSGKYESRLVSEVSKWSPAAEKTGYYYN